MSSEEDKRAEAKTMLRRITLWSGIIGTVFTAAGILLLVNDFDITLSLAVLGLGIGGVANYLLYVWAKYKTRNEE